LQSFESKYLEAKQFFEDFLEDYLSSSPVIDETLKKSIVYSLLNGGKRFRPVLSIFVAEALGIPPKKVLPFAAAVEMIHTYSLIHDDLPCMDNDDFRRGKPTNHKVFGEDVALLAGDALLTQAFSIVAQNYQHMVLVQLLSEAAGWKGMIGGQIHDMLSKKKQLSLDELMKINENKTGALIVLAVVGTLEIAGVSENLKVPFYSFAKHLGNAFQLKDDLQDSERAIEPGTIPSLVGIPKTKEMLVEATRQAKNFLNKIDIKNGPLVDMIEANFNRID
jgi:geranylgeranyl diphosphate synthase type II